MLGHIRLSIPSVARSAESPTATWLFRI
jgi:hypothetical protein